jgi:hypothetical protein
VRVEHVESKTMNEEMFFFLSPGTVEKQMHMPCLNTRLSHHLSNGLRKRCTVQINRSLAQKRGNSTGIHNC